jgi:hypothetical protein
MPIKKLDLQQRLRRKFGYQDVDGSKHEALELVIDDRKIATTRFSRSGSDISDGVLAQIAKELWVQLGYLKGMYNCTNTCEDYLQRLRESGRFT